MIYEKSGGHRTGPFNGNESNVRGMRGFNPAGNWALGRLGMSVFPGISQITPPSAGVSAKIRGGMGFGLGALGTVTDVNGNPIIDPATGAATSDVGIIGDLIQRGITMLNAEQVFQLNLQRAQNGLQPIPLSLAAPTVNFGLAGISGPMLLVAALGAMFLLKRKGR